jgi:hypothetical protein
VPDSEQLVPGAAARALLRQARRLRKSAHRLVERETAAQDDVRAAYAVLHARAVQRQLAEMPLSAVREGAGGRIRLDGLEEAGFRSVQSLRNASLQQLDAVPGIGPATAGRVQRAVRDLVTAIEGSTRVRIDLNPSDDAATRLLDALARLEMVQRASSRLGHRELDDDMTRLMAAAKPMGWRVRLFFTRRARREEAAAALGELQSRTQDAAARDLSQRLEQALVEARAAGLPREQLWRDFEQRSPEYYGVLGQVTDLGLNVVASQGFLPADLAQAVLEQPLNTEHLTVALRAYQSFGAKFVLVQGRVVLGD